MEGPGLGEARLRANELLLQLMCCSQPSSNLHAQSCVSGNDDDETWLIAGS